MEVISVVIIHVVLLVAEIVLLVVEVDVLMRVQQHVVILVLIPD